MARVKEAGLNEYKQPVTERAAMNMVVILIFLIGALVSAKFSKKRGAAWRVALAYSAGFATAFVTIFIAIFIGVFFFSYRFSSLPAYGSLAAFLGPLAGIIAVRAKQRQAREQPQSRV